MAKHIIFNNCSYETEAIPFQEMEHGCVIHSDLEIISILNFEPSQHSFTAIIVIGILTG